jgi:hypothetical protein
MRRSHHVGDGFPLQGNVIHLIALFCYREGHSHMVTCVDCQAPLRLAKNVA